MWEWRREIVRYQWNIHAMKHKFYCIFSYNFTIALYMLSNFIFFFYFVILFCRGCKVLVQYFNNKKPLKCILGRSYVRSRYGKYWKILKFKRPLVVIFRILFKFRISLKNALLRHLNHFKCIFSRLNNVYNEH